MASLHNNAYYRARIAAIQKLQDSNPSIKKFLQNGFVPADRKDSFEKFIQKYIVDNVDNSPLTFTEQMTYNTWYEQHPEKVAGTMVEGSSLYFPVLVKGTKTDVENMFKAALKEQEKEQKPKDDELELLELEAEALALELELGSEDSPQPKYKVGDIVNVEWKGTHSTYKELSLIIKDENPLFNLIDITPKGDGSYTLFASNRHWGINIDRLSPVDEKVQKKIRQSLDENDVNYFFKHNS